MSQYGVAWLIIGGAGLAVALCLWMLTRPIPWTWLRTLVRCLIPIWLLLPAPIQVVDDRYAPAFIVAIFEGFFRSGGEPWPAIYALIAATSIVLAVILIWAALRWYRGRTVLVEPKEAEG